MAHDVGDDIAGGRPDRVDDHVACRPLVGNVRSQRADHLGAREHAEVAHARLVQRSAGPARDAQQVDEAVARPITVPRLRGVGAVGNDGERAVEDGLRVSGEREERERGGEQAQTERGYCSSSAQECERRRVSARCWKK